LLLVSMEKEQEIEPGEVEEDERKKWSGNFL
jgi:hypothetical protein